MQPTSVISIQYCGLVFGSLRFHLRLLCAISSRYCHLFAVSFNASTFIITSGCFEFPFVCPYVLVGSRRPAMLPKRVALLAALGPLEGPRQGGAGSFAGGPAPPPLRKPPFTGGLRRLYSRPSRPPTSSPGPWSSCGLPCCHSCSIYVREALLSLMLWKPTVSHALLWRPCCRSSSICIYIYIDTYIYICMWEGMGLARVI